MDDFGSLLLAGLLSGGVIAAVLGLITARWAARIRSTVEDEARRITETRGLEWELLREVLGPVNAHMRRTNMAFTRWQAGNLLLETLIIADSNRKIRDILLDKFHLLTPELRDPASRLIEHFDVWLEMFERERNSQKPVDSQAKFTFAGPAGFPYPKDAETAFRASLDRTYAHLNGLETLSQPTGHRPQRSR